MASQIINSKTEALRVDKLLIIKQADQGTLYSAILAGTQLLPPNTMIKLVTSGGVGTIKLTGSTEAAWSAAQPIGASIASGTAISALTPVSTADSTDLDSAVLLSNANKAKINSIISALKS